mgnify:CR=1 FL=1
MPDRPFHRLDVDAAPPPAFARPVLAIGNFDGIHLGHVALMAEARALADRLGRPAGVLTFAPHPRQLLRPDAPFFALCSPDDKARLVARAGMDGMATLRFDEALVTTGAEAFVADLLVGRLGVSGVAIGENFRFGKGRAGTPGLMREMGARLGFETVVLPGVTIDGRPVSSSAVRAALAAGAVPLATTLLGRPWGVRGEVVHGDKRGRDLGFPTANMVLPAGIDLAHGVYAVRAEIDGRLVDGAASFGRRPTFDDGAPRLETFLFDFQGDLYGRRIGVEFIDRVRGEEKFDGVAPLIAAMHRDVATARRMLADARDAGLGSFFG